MVRLKHIQDTYNDGCFILIRQLSDIPVLFSQLLLHILTQSPENFILLVRQLFYGVKSNFYSTHLKIVPFYILIFSGQPKYNCQRRRASVLQF